MNTEEARPVFRWAPLGRASAHRFPSHTIFPFDYHSVSGDKKYKNQHKLEQEQARIRLWSWQEGGLSAAAQNHDDSDDDNDDDDSTQTYVHEFLFPPGSGIHRCRRRPSAPVNCFQAAPASLLPAVCFGITHFVGGLWSRRSTVATGLPPSVA